MRLFVVLVFTFALSFVSTFTIAFMINLQHLDSYCNQDDFRAKIIAEEWVEKALEYPDGLEFNDLWMSEAIILDSINCVWEVRGWIRVRNSAVSFKSKYIAKLKIIKGTKDFDLIVLKIGGYESNG